MPEVFTRLFPDHAAGLSATDVAGAIAPDELPARRPFVLLNMIMSADGRATVAGHTSALQNRADHELFHALRGRADAVMVGASTVRAESYGPMAPACILLSRSLEISADVGLLRAEGNRVLVVTPAPEAELPPCAASVEYVREPDPRVALERLRAEHGIEFVLCEGGPHVNAQLLPAGLVDELHLVLAARLVAGTDPFTIVEGGVFDPPLDLGLRSVHESGGFLFLRYVVEHDGRV